MTNNDLPRITPEELAQTKKTMRFVFDVVNSRSLAELDLVISSYVLSGGYFGNHAADLVQRERTRLGGKQRPS